MNKIDEHLYVGNLEAAKNSENLKKYQIGFILTVDITPLPENNSKNFVTKFIEAEDDETCDILSRLEECLDFVEDSINDGGNVLIHCHAGVSRSVCVAAAYLMRKYKLALIEAEEKIQEVKSDIELNPGFIRQLLSFESMGWKVDPNHPIYKHHKFRNLRHQIQTGGHQSLAPSMIADNPAVSKESKELADFVYKCKKCRKAVFRQNNVYPHEIDETRAFEPKISDMNSTIKCSSLFLEPIKWMEDCIVSTLTGKLNCPHCSFRLGKFNWAGAQCSCGKWVTPALQIHASNVDKTN